jgi:hypothetical protein
MLIARPISSPSPWFFGCRQLAWKSWDRGRGNRLPEHIRSGRRSCHWQKRRHRKRCRRRRDGPGTWLSFGIAQEIGSKTSVPFGEKENFADASPRVPARGPRRASLCCGVRQQAALLPLHSAHYVADRYSPLHAALFMLPISISAFVAGSLNGFVLHKVGIGRALWTSLIVAATGLIGYAVFRNSSAVEQVASLVIFGFGVGVGSAMASTAIMINAPEDKAGMAASIESVAYGQGGALGVTILGSILSFTYTKALVLPQGIPAPAPARDSLDQALLLAEHLSGDATVKLITQAKTAFDIAFVTVLVAGTAIMLLMAAVIARIISRAKTPEPSRVPHS